MTAEDGWLRKLMNHPGQLPKEQMTPGAPVRPNNFLPFWSRRNAAYRALFRANHGCTSHHRGSCTLEWDVLVQVARPHKWSMLSWFSGHSHSKGTGRFSTTNSWKQQKWKGNITRFCSKLIMVVAPLITAVTVSQQSSLIFIPGSRSSLKCISTVQCNFSSASLQPVCSENAMQGICDPACGQMWTIWFGQIPDSNAAER